MTMKFARPILAALVAAILLAPHSASADVRLARIFTDHMVLQQKMPVRIWGWADVGESVTVAFNGKSADTKAGEDGTWRVELPAMNADSKPRTLTVQGKNTLELKDILLGEVWIAAGQSNMNREARITDDHPEVRLFWIHGSTVPREHDLGDNAIGWLAATKSNVEDIKEQRQKFGRGHKDGFAEVGWVFGLRVQKKLGAPVGLIKSAYGGSQAKAWTPRDDIAEDFPYDKKVEGGYLGHRPGLLYQSMLHGMPPLSVRGVVWYQGENNGRDWDYDKELTAMIRSWRNVFQQPDMPFYMAQIAQTTYASGMVRVWECQAKVAKEVPNVYLGMSVNLYDGDGGGRNAVRKDEGKPDKPGTGWPIVGGSNPHPPNKHIVANRLADIALVKTYGKDLGREVLAPRYASHRTEGNKLIITFDHIGEGLKTDDGNAPNWFEISDGTARDNRKTSPLTYHKATAKITGNNTVELTSDKVTSPKHARLAWHVLARHNLTNSAGVPAINFRTDERPTKQR